MNLSNIKFSSVYIYGAGAYGSRVFYECLKNNIKVEAFLDTNADKIKNKLGLPVLHPSIDNLKPYIIIAIKNKKVVKEIVKKLEQQDFKKKKDFQTVNFTLTLFLEKLVDFLNTNVIKRAYLHLLYKLTKKKNFKYKVSVAAIAKNEGIYLKEWIEYHKLVGVEHFYFYDNESNDNTKEILQPYIDSNLVEYKYVKSYVKYNKNNRGMFKPQMPAFTDAVKKSRLKTKWLALIDADEFIVPLSKEKIGDVLDEVEGTFFKNKPFVALAVHWFIYNYNGHQTKPKGLVIENYTKSLGIDKHIKSIVNPRTVLYFEHMHYANHILNLHGVNENGKEIKNPPYWNEHVTEQDARKIRINHYATKSYEEYKQRIEKNRKGNIYTYNLKQYNLLPFEQIKEDSNEDFVMDRYVKLLSNLS